MKTKWSETVGNKVLLTVRIVLSVVVVALASLQLLGVLENALLYAVPLLGVYFLILSTQEWKQHRGLAIFSLCVAVFIFAVSIVVWVGK